MKGAEKIIKVALIGGGKISEQHLIALATTTGVNVKGVCDLSPAVARYTARRFGVERWFTDYRVMLKSINPDVVHVLTPPATHTEIARDCIDSGAHVIIEKPITLSNPEFNALWSYAEDHNLSIIENQNYRFNPPVQQLRSIVDSKKLGTIEEVEVRMSLNLRNGGRYADRNMPHPSHQLPGGVLHEFITHLAYLFLYFMPIDTVEQCDVMHAYWKNHEHDELFKYDDLDAIVMAGSTHGRIRFSSRQWPDSFSITVRGSKGIAYAEIFQPVCQIIISRRGGIHLTPFVNYWKEGVTSLKSAFRSIWRKIRNKNAYQGLEIFIKLYYEALRNGGEMPVSFKDINTANLLVDALLAPENRK